MAFKQTSVSCCKILEPYRKCAGAVQLREATILSRRGIGDKEIWTKPLAACRGRGGAMGLAGVFEDSPVFSHVLRSSDIAFYWERVSRRGLGKAAIPRYQVHPS